MKHRSVISAVEIGFCIVLTAWVAACTAGVQSAVSAPVQLWHGLTVSPGGNLEKDGHPYRGIGVNFVGALRRLLVNPDDPSVPRDFKELEAYHIPFVRFPALAVWGTPARCRRYLDRVYVNNPGSYFTAMDNLCAIANEYHVGLIPSLFFTFWPDALSHHHGLAAANNPQSHVFHIWTQYTIHMVTRYEHNPAIWGWEFGNEFNLRADLPKTRLPNNKSAWGYTHSQMWELYGRFVHLVRQYDPYHIIEAGNSRPRNDSWHNMVDHTWKKDSPAQWAYMLKKDNAAFDMICVHEYRGLAPANITRVAALAGAWHKPLYVGEFGASGPPAKSRRLFAAILDSILRNNVPLASVWSFDQRLKSSGPHANSITPTNDRRFMLKAIETADEQFLNGH